MFIFGIIVAVLGWIILLISGTKDSVNVNVLWVSSNIIYLGYFLVLLHVVRKGVRRLGAKSRPAET